jgi:hypothetical protein
MPEFALLRATVLESVAARVKYGFTRRALLLRTGETIPLGLRKKVSPALCF